MYRKICFLILLLTSCQDKKKVEANVLSPNQMAKVLIEIHLAEAQIPHLALSPDSAQQIYRTFEKKVFDKAGIDSATYYQSYQYYLNRIEEFEKIYAVVIDSLVYRESRMDIGKPMDSSTKTNFPQKSYIDSSGLELKKRKIKMLLRKEIELNK